MTDPIQRPPSPSGSDKRGSGFKPSDYNPDLANTEMVKNLMERLPNPTIVTKKFTVFHGILKSLNHTEENKTFINTGPLSKLMEEVGRESVNVDGWYIKSLFAYFMHPIVNIMQGGFMPTQPMQEESQPWFGARIWNRITGKGNPQEAKTQ